MGVGGGGQTNKKRKERPGRKKEMKRNEKTKWQRKQQTAN